MSSKALDFTGIRDWIFDLDNTLYPHHINLFEQIDWNMTHYVAELLNMERDEARALQKRYYHEHGTTLAGLMANHNVDPDAFLERAHAIDYSRLETDEKLGDAIKALPGRKFIFTNGTVAHAEAAAGALGILDHFDDIFDIVAADYIPKPALTPYDKFRTLKNIDPRQAAMFEDLPRNLEVPKQLGMKTVLIVPRNLDLVLLEDWEKANGQPHIDHVTDNLGHFLSTLTLSA